MAFDFKKFSEKAKQLGSVPSQVSEKVKAKTAFLKKKTPSTEKREPSKFALQFSKFTTKARAIIRRIVRAFCLVLGLAVIAIGIFVAGVFYFVNPDAAKNSFVTIAHENFGIKAVISEPVKVNHFPRLSIEFPKVQLQREADSSLLASLEALRVDVSLWSLPLGAIRLDSTNVDGLKTTMHLEDFLGKDAFQKSFGKITFPKNLRVREVILTNSTVEVLKNDSTLLTLEKLDARLGELSPESDAPISANLHFRDSSVEGESQSSVKGSLSLEASLGISSSASTLTLRNLSTSGSVTNLSGEHVLLASASRLRFNPDEATGVNLKISVSAPDKTKGDFSFALADFLATATRLATPEMQVTFQKETETSSAKIDLATAVDTNLTTKAVRFSDITGNIHTKGLSGFPENFLATIKGSAEGSLAEKNLSLTLGGSLAQSAFTYNGTLQWTDSPRLAGNLTLAALEFDKTPVISNLPWLHSVDYEGELRIGKLRVENIVAEQLHANLHLTDGLLSTKDAVLNLAEGRMQGAFQLTDTGDWTADCVLDSVSFEKLFVVSPLAGKTNCSLKLSGKGNDFTTVSGSGTLRTLRGELRGINLEKPTSTNLATRKAAKSAFDEASAEINLSDGILATENLIVQNALCRLAAIVQINLVDKSISGSADLFHTPGGSVPTRDKALLSGAWSDPVWTIPTRSADSATKIERRTIEGFSSKRQQIWTNLKNFLKF